MNEFYPEGERCLTPENALALSSLAGLEKAMEEKTLLEAKSALCDRDLSLVFDLGGIRGVMPREEVAVTEEDAPIRDIGVITRVGKPCVFLVDRIEKKRRKNAWGNSSTKKKTAISWKLGSRIFPPSGRSAISGAGSFP